MVGKQETANTQVSKTRRLHIVGGERSRNGGGWGRLKLEKANSRHKGHCGLVAWKHGSAGWSVLSGD